MRSPAQFVFGYGSLVALPGQAFTRRLAPHGFVADLEGVRRGWGVAMDNRVDVAGYKYYTDAEDRRPEIFVAFLDLLEGSDDDGGSVVNGLCRPVDESALGALDRRERNYVRVDVSERIGGAGASAGRVWAYLGRPEARERLAEGRRRGIAVIDAGYRDAVQRAFSALGEEELRACLPSLDPVGLPVLALRRHEL